MGLQKSFKRNTATKPFLRGEKIFNGNARVLTGAATKTVPFSLRVAINELANGRPPSFVTLGDGPCEEPLQEKYGENDVDP